MDGEEILGRLYDLLRERKKTLPPDSYTASLYRQGEDAVLKKIGEESSEVLLASKSGVAGDIIHEVADLIFHLVVLLGYHEIEPRQILNELNRRFEKPGAGPAR